ncbi:hypothetical protein [Bartonella sp. AP153HLJHH]|uniref:hypothetical protein n=1 Tax=Bartonella sp. AP153HLJHH TaxID=3243470 RepID=UPI0035CEF2FE
MPPERIKAEMAKFRDFWKARTGKDARKTDWKAMWRNWVQKAIEDLENGKNYGNHSQRQKSVDERISDSILDIGPRGHFETHSRDDNSGVSFSFEKWQALTQQQEAIALEACDQLHELFSIKVSKEDITKAIRMLSVWFKNFATDRS